MASLDSQVSSKFYNIFLKCQIAALPALGFTTAGIAASSTAAGMQAGIGNVVAGSAFAMLQSAGATGVGSAIGAAVGATAGGIGGALATGKSFSKPLLLIKT